MINEKNKHIELRNKVENLLNEGLTANVISEKLGIRVGHQRDKGSVKWFLRCIRSKNHMINIHKIYPHIFTRKKVFDIEKIKEMYLSDELPPYKIAKIMKCDTITIFNRLRDMGIKTRSYKESRQAKTYEGVTKIKNSGLIPEKAYILGVLCGDAWISLKNYHVGLRVIDLDFAEEFQKNIKIVYGLDSKIRIFKPGKENWSNQYVVQINSKLLCEDIVSYGNFNTDNWRVPKEIFESNDIKMIGNFLRGFYDSEGHVNPKEYVLKATSSNKEGFLDILNLLRKLGIHYITILKKHKNPKYKLGYEVLITGSDSYKFFKEYIGFSIKRKHDALLQLQNVRKQKRYTKEDFEKALELRKEGLHQAEIARRTGVIHSTISNWFKEEEYYFKLFNSKVGLIAS